MPLPTKISVCTSQKKGRSIIHIASPLIVTLLFESIMSSDAGTRKRSRREVTSRKPGDDDRWNAAQTSVASVKNVIIDERRNVMRNLPDPKLFPGDEYI